MEYSNLLLFVGYHMSSPNAAFNIRYNSNNLLVSTITVRLSIKDTTQQQRERRRRRKKKKKREIETGIVKKISYLDND